jgi:hypothetical protein
MNSFRTLARVTIVLCMAGFAPAFAQDDAAELKLMLQEFLANADKRGAHERFWADDLVYSSSSGLRFGKADIMQGFDTTDDETNSEPPAVVYSGEEIDVMLYGDMAVVVFKLVGTPSSGSEPLYYYNTGTFLKRDGVWRVVAWQATKIPTEGAD